jgi:ABC-type uncharacterized transport system substrate-binding protein
VLFYTLAFLFGSGCFAAEVGDIPIPLPHKAFRIAYLESAPYRVFGVLYSNIRSQLEALGWGGEVIVFPQELHYTLGEDTKDKRMIEEIYAKGGFDLLLSFGTEATKQALGANSGKVPIVGTSISDAIAADIVPSKTDSGTDNFTTALNIAAGSFMVMAFHQIANFKKLGILYSDTQIGRIFSYVDDVAEVAREHGFEIVSYPHLSVVSTVEECLAGVKYLHSQGVDAVFVGALPCIDLQIVDPSPIYSFLDSKHIPVFVAENKEQVKHFATIGMTIFNEDEIATFHAEQIIRILSGTKPRDLPMIIPFNFRLQINLDAVRENKLNLRLESLLNADEIYLRRDYVNPYLHLDEH